MKKEHQEIIDKLEQGITLTNSQSGIAKEFDIQEKNNTITDIVSKALSVANIAIEISKNLSNFKGYKKKTPRKLVSIYNKVKKNDSRSFHCVNFAIKQAMLWNQLMIIKSQRIAPTNFPKGGIVVGGCDSESELSVPKRIAELMALKKNKKTNETTKRREQ